MKFNLLFFFILGFGMNCAFAQNAPENQMDLDLQSMDQLFGGMMQELEQALQESHMLMDEMDMRNLGDGKMYIDGDSVNISGLFDMMNGTFKQLPKGMRPSDNYLDGLEGTSKMLPDLLMKSLDMFNGGEFERIFGDLFGEFDMESPFPIPEQRNSEVPPNERTNPDEPRPTTPRGEEKPKKKLKHRKTVTI